VRKLEMCKPLDEANALVRSLDIIILGLESDAVEALSPYRTERSVRDVKEGLKSARKSVTQLQAKLLEVPYGNAEAGIDGT
jgi:hypothetical protein